jgi:hypothetical protein
LDFEYFGWDDPAKTAADFCLHPAMGLSADLWRYFIAHFPSLFIDPQELLIRLRMRFPLYVIKWCLILLNEFIPEALDRRIFAANSPSQTIDRRQRQLGKAKNMFGRIHDEILGN